MLDRIISNSHLETAKLQSKALKQVIDNGNIEIDGEKMTISEVVAASKHGCQPYLTNDPEVIAAINQSVAVLADFIKDGHHIYGVNTGFGGSADSRTDQMVTLQSSLLQLLQSGILTSADTTNKSPRSHVSMSDRQSMPREWVRATMIVRSNSVARGHSAVSVTAINSILRLLREDVTPVVPLRGTISASGDLMPLAYIVGAIEGSTGVFVQIGNNSDYRVTTAQEALKAIDADALVMGPKEGLGLVNGTAASCALASLVMYEAHQLALLAQAVTGLTVEALRGSADSFHPFIAEVRPQEGQSEAARNILSFIRGSFLTRTSDGSKKRAGLVQDRYSLRTASQWIGPQLEDLLLADRQVSIELNSTSDNPLIDNEAETFYSGGNFQATSVTSAMEKSRLALQMLGKLLFVQCSEMTDPGLNNGLPTNLVADDPSLSFTMKGVDINMAAYMSELAYLANPVSSHVQTAEMHNQAINSLAFLSARYSMQAVDVVWMMGACSLYVACQALDLRVLQLRFFQILPRFIHGTIQDIFESNLDPNDIQKISDNFMDQVQISWLSTSRMDLCERCQRVVEMALPTFLSDLSDHMTPTHEGYEVFEGIRAWKKAAPLRLEDVYREVLSEFSNSQPTVAYLGVGSKAIYTAIRHDVGVPFHQGFVEHPQAGMNVLPQMLNGREKKTVGGWISMIYEALRDGILGETLIGSLSHSSEEVRS